MATFKSDIRNQNRTETRFPVESSAGALATQISVHAYALFGDGDPINIENRQAGEVFSTGVVGTPANFLLNLATPLPDNWNGANALPAGSLVYDGLPAAVTSGGTLPPNAQFTYIEVGATVPGNYMRLGSYVDNNTNDYVAIKNPDVPMVLGDYAPDDVSPVAAGQVLFNRVNLTADDFAGNTYEGNQFWSATGEIRVASVLEPRLIMTQSPTVTNNGLQLYVRTGDLPGRAGNYAWWFVGAGISQFQFCTLSTSSPSPIDLIQFGNNISTNNVNANQNMLYDFHMADTARNLIQFQIGSQTTLDYVPIQPQGGPMVFGSEVPIGIADGWSFALNPEMQYHTGINANTTQYHFDGRLCTNKMTGRDAVLQCIEWDGTAAGGVNRAGMFWIRDAAPGTADMNFTGKTLTEVRLCPILSSTEYDFTVNLFSGLPAQNNINAVGGRTFQIYCATATDLGSDVGLVFGDTTARDYIPLKPIDIPLLIGASDPTDPANVPAAAGEVMFTDTTYFPGTANSTSYSNIGADGKLDLWGGADPLGTQSDGPWLRMFSEDPDGASWRVAIRSYDNPTNFRSYVSIAFRHSTQPASGAKILSYAGHTQNWVNHIAWGEDLQLNTVRADSIIYTFGGIDSVRGAINLEIGTQSLVDYMPMACTTHPLVLGSNTPAVTLPTTTPGDIITTNQVHAEKDVFVDGHRVATVGMVTNEKQVFQYGSGTLDGTGNLAVTFPTAFNATPGAVVACYFGILAGGNPDTITVSAVSNLGFTATGAIGEAFSWIAVGNGGVI